MLHLMKIRVARMAALAAMSCLGIAAAGCGSSSASPGSAAGSTQGGSPAAGQASGTVGVAYAASLAYLNEKIVGPAFATASGLNYSGTAGPSGALESEIASKAITPDVFEAIGGDSITPLFPKFTSWYVQYATTSIVLAYNPRGKHASQFKAIASGAKPITDLFALLETPGLRLGRTDPNTDPQGRAFIYMLELAQMKYHLPSDTVTKIIGSPIASANSAQIFAEASLESTLQAGQLDAASAYLSQARQLHLSYITLPSAINLGDAADATTYYKASITITGNATNHGAPLTIDITVISGSPTGTKFVAYVLSPAGRALHQQGGYTLLKPTLTGSGAPASVLSELGS